MIWSLHGAVGLAADWNDCRERMVAAGHQLRAVDLWKYLDPLPITLEEFGEYLCEEVAAADDRPVLLGYWMGGRLALHALLARPSLWRAAVIVSAHPGLTSERERILRLADDAHWAARALQGAWPSFLESWHAQPLLGGPVHGLADRITLNPRRYAVVRSFTHWSLGQQADLRARLPTIKCPVLWITGERDHKFRELAAEAAPRLPHARQLVIPNAGHRVPWDAPEAFATELASFLDTPAAIP